MMKKISVLVVVLLMLAAFATVFAEGETPIMGGVVRYAIAEESRGLDPVQSTRRFSDSGAHFYDALVYQTPDGEYHGGLATSWEVNEDATEYTFHLRDDVTFQDGTKFNAEVVKAHYDRIHDPEWCCGNAFEYTKPYVETRVDDEYTATVVFSEPFGAFQYFVSIMDVSGMVSPTAIDTCGKEVNTLPAGSGPFKFVEWIPQTQITAVRNEDYNWAPDFFDHSGAPYVDGLEVKFIPDLTTMVACLEAGDCDIIKSPNAIDIIRLQNDPRFHLERTRQTGVPFSFTFNTLRWPTSEFEVRKAVNLAIDRARVSQAAYLGTKDPFYSVLADASPEMWEGAKDLFYYAPDEAKAVLAEAGWADTDGDGVVEKDGKACELDMYVFGSQEANSAVVAAESMQADLAKVGIKVNILVRPWDDQSLIAAKKEHNLINFDMPSPDASVLSTLFHSKEAPVEGSYGMGFSWFHEVNADEAAKLDKILDDAGNASTLEERNELYQEAQKIIGENYLLMPVVQGYTDYLVSAKLHGVKYNMSGHAFFNDAWLEK